MHHSGAARNSQPPTPLTDLSGFRSAFDAVADQITRRKKAARKRLFLDAAKNYLAAGAAGAAAGADASAAGAGATTGAGASTGTSFLPQAARAKAATIAAKTSDLFIF